MSVTKPGMIRSDAGEQDHDAMRELTAGIAPGVQFAADSGHDAEPLVRSRIVPAMPVAITRPRVAQHADLAADQHEAGDFQQRKGEKEQWNDRKAHQAVRRSSWVGRMAGDSLLAHCLYR